ncbi:MAG: hypothetical protein ABJA94_07375 [Rhodoglobus sp.]
MNRLVIAGATGFIALAAVAGVAGSANAATLSSADSAPAHAKATVASVQAASATRTSKLISNIGKIETRVAAAKHLTADEQATIKTALDADITAVQTGAATVAADTTVKQARTDSRATLASGRAAVKAEVKVIKDDRAAHTTP